MTALCEGDEIHWPTAEEREAFDAMMDDHWRRHCYPLRIEIWGIRPMIFDLPDDPNVCVLIAARCGR